MQSQFVCFTQGTKSVRRFVVAGQGKKDVLVLALSKPEYTPKTGETAKVALFTGRGSTHEVQYLVGSVTWCRSVMIVSLLPVDTEVGGVRNTEEKKHCVVWGLFGKSFADLVCVEFVSTDTLVSQLCE